MSQLQAYADAFRRSRSAAHALTDGCSGEAFNWKPSPDAWSVGECFAHLNLFGAAYVPLFERTVSADDAPRGEEPFRYGWFSRRFIAAMDPGGRPISTFASMRPPAADPDRSHLDMDRTLADFNAWTDRYVAAIEGAEGLDLARIKVRSPFLKLVRLPLGAFFEALGQHALRHVAQAERVTQQPGFPR